jgi:polyisoprenoid-binding protein YceI
MCYDHIHQGLTYEVEMRNVFLTLALTMSVGPIATAQVQTWNIDQAHTAAQFSVRHLGISTVRGAFTKVSGTVQYDSAAPEKTVIDATIDAASIDTRVTMRDNDLRSANFFDVAKFPTLTFQSKHVEATEPGKLRVTGDLTIHGVTKEAVLEVEGPSAPVKDGKGNMHMGASASTKINRTDFGVKGAAAVVGNEIPITIDIELVHSAPPTP